MLFPFVTQIFRPNDALQLICLSHAHKLEMFLVGSAKQ